MVIAVFAQCIFRFVFVTIGLKFFFSESILYLSSALCWTLAGILAFIYFHTSKWVKQAQVR
jgi:Na+-driven multidrug efflux pump